MRLGNTSSICQDCQNEKNQDYLNTWVKSAVILSCSVFFAGLERHIYCPMDHHTDYENSGTLGFIAGAVTGYGITRKLEDIIKKCLPDRKCQHVKPHQNNANSPVCNQKHPPGQNSQNNNKIAVPEAKNKMLSGTDKHLENKYSSHLFKLKKHIDTFTIHISKLDNILKKISFKQQQLLNTLKNQQHGLINMNHLKIKNRFQILL